MSDEELKKERMQVLYDYEEVSKQLKARRAQAQRIGDDLRGFGEMLLRSPETAVIGSDSIPVELRYAPSINPGSLDVVKIREITSSIRELQAKLGSLEERKKALGY